MSSDNALSASCHSLGHQAHRHLPSTHPQEPWFFPKTVILTRGRREECRCGPLNMSTERLFQLRLLRYSMTIRQGNSSSRQR